MYRSLLFTWHLRARSCTHSMICHRIFRRPKINWMNQLKISWRRAKQLKFGRTKANSFPSKHEARPICILNFVQNHTAEWRNKIAQIHTRIFFIIKFSWYESYATLNKLFANHLTRTTRKQRLKHSNAIQLCDVGLCTSLILAFLCLAPIHLAVLATNVDIVSALSRYVYTPYSVHMIPHSFIPS